MKVQCKFYVNIHRDILSCSVKECKQFYSLLAVMKELLRQP